MAVELYLAPAGHGKSHFIFKQVQQSLATQERSRLAQPGLCLPGTLQRESWRRRLSREGALGVHLFTVPTLVDTLLEMAGVPALEFSEPVQHRLLRQVVDRLVAADCLPHYAALQNRPGFFRALSQTIAALKAARLSPEQFLDNIAPEVRLQELGRIYEGYERCLEAAGGTDYAGTALLALKALQNKRLPLPWSLLLFDSFDNFTPVQIALIDALGRQVERVVITLTGTLENGGAGERVAHHRFADTCRALQEGVAGLTLHDGSRRFTPTGQPALLERLEQTLFRSNQLLPEPENGVPPRQESRDGTVTLIVAADRADEVDQALRWLKKEQVQGGIPLATMALLAKDITQYRPFLQSSAAEYGIPLKFTCGLPLGQHPALVALLDLLRLALPLRGNGRAAEPALPRQKVIDAWLSPWFDWGESGAGVGITAEEGAALDQLSRETNVIEGLSQWQQALAGQPLESRFDSFYHCLPALETAPFIRHLEKVELLIGPDVEQGTRRGSLNLIESARRRQEPEALADTVAALHAFKELLRDLLWAAEVQELPPLSLPDFLAEVEGLLESRTYHPPLAWPALLVADIAEARGLAFQAVALLGLAEGEFPAAVQEDPLLRDEERQQINTRLGRRPTPLPPLLQHGDLELFYETLVKPRKRLLLTRPQLADNGAAWPPSPFWLEAGGLLRAWDQLRPVDGALTPDQAAGPSERMQALARQPGPTQWLRPEEEARWQRLEQAAAIFKQRYTATRGPFDGDLSEAAAGCAAAFGPDHRWSAGQLESYRRCPYHFFVERALRPERLHQPQLGPDVAILGTIYHTLLEQVYAPGRTADLPELAAQMKRTAPDRYQFRAPPWWSEQMARIEQQVAQNVAALDALPGEFSAYRSELSFGLKGAPPLLLSRGAEQIRLAGIIDRVDRNPQGQLRLIDYKLAGPANFKPAALQQGRKIQLPLYALAAEQALQLGPVQEGFYWHLTKAEASPLKLSEFVQEGEQPEEAQAGPAAALETAARHAWQAVDGARAGSFAPTPPPDGCPDYCPAAGFCWHYQPGFRG